MTAAEIRVRYVRIGLAFYVVWVAVFILEGLYAATLPTFDLTMQIDTQVPVVSEFAWVYVSCYLFPLILLAITANWHRFNLALLAIAICTLIAFIGHLALPVAFPRPSLGSSFSDRFVRFIYENDFKPGAQNFPSLHVAIAWIVAFSSRGQGLGGRAESAMLFYALLISASTILIKQHLVVDFIGGILLACTVWPLLKQHYDRVVPAGDPPLASLRLMVRALAPLWALLVLCVGVVVAVQQLRSV